MDEQRYRRAERDLWSSLGVDPTEITVDVAGTRLRVQVVGDGPPALFVHGGSVCGTCWAPLAARLDGWRCLLVDRPGCGLSEPLDLRLDDIDRFVAHADAFVPALLDAMSIERAPVVATSFGGCYALRAAAHRSDRVTRVLHFGWVFGAPMEAVPVAMRVTAVRPLAAAMTRIPPSKAMVRSILRQIGLGGALASGRMSDEAVEWFRSVLRDTDTMRNELRTNPPLIRPLRGLDPDVLFDDELLASIPVPVSLQWGTHDPMGGADTARAFAARVPEAGLDLWDGAGHAPWMDDPDRAADVATSFLAGHTGAD